MNFLCKCWSQSLTYLCSSKDRAMIIEQLVAYNVFNQISGRVYPAFKKFDEHMYDPMSMVDFQAWMEQQLQKLLMFSS